MELFKERIEIHRSKLEQNVDVDKLYPLLQQDKAISMEEISEIEALSSKSAKVGKLLDIILAKDATALQSFYLVLQQMYQHILAVMFSEPTFSTSHGSQQESCSTSMTSDSEDDGSRIQISPDCRPGEFNTRPKLAKNDPNNTMSSSFPTFSPLSQSADHSSSGVASPSSMFVGHGYPDKGYDWFFKQFERAFSELHGLKQQNAEMIDMRYRYDQVSKEVKHLRSLYKTESQCLQQATSEIHIIKAQQAELLAEKKQLLDEIACLQKLRSEDKLELAELRHQQRKTAREASSNDGLGELYAAVLDKYENICKDYDLLREKYPELMAAHNSALARLTDVSEDNAKLRSQLDEIIAKYDALSLERNGLKQQCTNAIREWNQTLMKHSQVKEQLAMVIRQRDDFCKDFNQTFAKHAEMKKNCEALKAEKDAAVKEYALVMSERDTVHKEIEQLQDKLGSMSKLVEVLSCEKKEQGSQLENIRRDMASVLSERDKYRRERNDISGINQGLKHEFQLRMEQQRDMAWKERNEAYEHMEQIIKETYEKTQKEKAEEIDNVAKESENLKKHLEKLKLDLLNAEQEAENANKNRDKAFSERDKIVQERESIRTLCDNLRRDRDRAVSDLAQALRDSDEFKRQKNEAVKESKEIKNRYEVLVEKDTRRHQLHSVGHNHSHDSAIDADLHDLATETVEISVQLHNAGPGDIGFEIIGGKDDPQSPNDPNLFISHVSKGSAAEGKLRVNDTLVRINSLETVNVDKRTALQALWTHSGPINLVVRRRKSSAARIWQPVQIVMTCQKDPGIQIEQGLFISRICPGGVVAKYGVLPCVGDRIISINNICADRVTPREAMKLLQTCTDSLVLDVWRQSSPLSSAGSSPTPILAGLGSPLHDSHSVSTNMSKSDTLAVCNSSWDTPSYACRTTDSSKIVRSSGSQTDSLDSPGPSPCKTLRNQEPDKVRHSLPMLDKAKVRVEKIFRVWHKSQDRDKDSEDRDKDSEDRDKDSEDKKERDEEQQLHRLQGHQDCGTQVSLSSTENVIAEFPSNPDYTNITGSSANSVARNSKTRKRDWELDSNSGTWPKARGQQGQGTSGPPTVIFAPGYKPIKDRPSIRDIFYSSPGGSSYDTQFPCGPAIPHSLQSSDSSAKNCPAVFSPTSASSVMSQSELTNCLPLSSSKASTSLFIPAAVAQSHFTVGIMHAPNVNTSNSSAVSSRGPPVFAKPSPAQLYGTVPSYRHNGGHKGSLVSSHHSHVQPIGISPNGVSVPQDFRLETAMRVAPKGQQVKSRRPTSVPHKPEPQWQTSSPLSWSATGQASRESPVGYQTGHMGAPFSRFAGSSATSLGSPPPPHAVSGALRYSGLNVAGSSASHNPPPRYSGLNIAGSSASHNPPPRYSGLNVAGSSAAQVQTNPPPYGMRPVSLEVPQSMKVTDFATGIYERNRMSSPAGQAFIGQPPYYPAHTNPTVFSPFTSSSQQPPGTFPITSPADLEHDRPLSFHGAPADRYSSPSPSQKSYSTAERFTPTISEEFYPTRYQHSSPHSRTLIDEDIRQAAFKRERVFERIRIPSSTSVNTKSASVEIALSDRSSPGSPMFHIDNRESIKYKGSNHSDEYIYRRKIPQHHETRDITFEKSSKPVGFKIQQAISGGIFVSSVSEHSLAAQAGLVIGDQLLEVCGINMRNANYKHAVTVLSQCGDNLTIKVQYNPEKYADHQDASSTTSMNSSLTTSPNHCHQQASEKHHSSPSKHHKQGSGDVSPDKRRYLTLRKSNPNMIGPGFSFIGGNAVGIFVHEVYRDCFVGGTHSLQSGDHILEFNSVDFRAVTAEKAMMELTRPCATMVLCVYYNFAKYTKIQTMPCDSFYIRANFDRASEVDEELGFHRDDTLYVDNSLYKNQLGTWFAWLVNDQGTKLKGGTIPSRIRLEDELVLRRTHSESKSLHETDDLKGSRRGSISARRSFFRKKRHHRNNSKDSHEFGSFSDASLSSDSVPILDDSILGYTQVEKVELKVMRPVVLLAPLADALIKKIVSESPDKYRHCEPSTMRSSSATMEQSLAEGVLIDYWKEEDVYQCIRTSTVKEICDSNVHCLLSVSPGSVERMHQCKVYPITIFVRHKNAKQIRDVRDPQFLKERASNKVAKEHFDQFQKTEQDYSHLFSAIIPGGNLAEMCMQIKAVISKEQKNAIWVTTNPI